MPSPLQTSREDRRSLLSRHFIPVVEQLIEAGEGGYADLSVERIIRAGGISRSTFYSYFDDKGALLGAMATDVVADLLGTGDSWWDFDPARGRDALRDALRPPIEIYRQHRTILGAVVEAAAYDARAREQLTRLVDGAAAALAAHISRHGAPGLDAERTAAWLIWMIERGLYQLMGDAPDREADRLLDAVTEIAWRALYADVR